MAAARRPDSIDVFRERSTARAYLWSTGEYSLHEAVDALQRDAEQQGVLERIGQDAVQAILTAAFQPYRNCADG